MFDDNQSQAKGQVPGNLPTGEPEDIFQGTDDTLNSAPPDLVEANPSDDLSVPNTALGAGILRPKLNTNLADKIPPAVDNFMSGEYAAQAQSPIRTPSRSVFGAAGPLETDQIDQASSAAYKDVSSVPKMNTYQDNSQGGTDVYSIKEPIGSRKTIMWIVIIVLVVVLGIGSAWIYFSFIRNNDATDGFGTPNNSTDFNTEGQSTDTASDNDLEPTDTQSVDTTNSQTDGNSGGQELDVDQNILFGEPIDTDGDALDDIREADIGTDPLNWDTDGDELSDSDEITVWKTNPLNPDTDGDGYFDGAEIRNGYSPTGPGKLFELPAEEENS